MTTMTERLARHALQIDVGAGDAKLKEISLCCVLDLLTASIAGAQTAGPLAALGLVDLHGKGDAPVWFQDRQSSVSLALLHNGLCASSLDLDDGNRAARGHPGASVIPTVLTLGSTMREVTGSPILSAIAAGYDVGVRVAASQRLDAIATRQTGRWAAFASCAAAARLLEVSCEVLSQGLAIAGVLAPNQRANGSSGYSKVTGNLVKEGIAFSARTGIEALFLAQRGFTGPIDLLDHDRFYDQGRLIAELGRRFEISDTYFKPYACCRYIHPALDALTQMMQANGLVADDIERINVHSFAQALRLANSHNPQTLVGVQYSLPFCLAVLAIEGQEALLPVSEDLLSREDLARFAERVTLSISDEAEARFPRETLARLQLTLKSGSVVSSALMSPQGDPSMPMNRTFLASKLQRVLTNRGIADLYRPVVDAVEALEGGNPRPLFALLETGLPRSSTVFGE